MRSVYNVTWYIIHLDQVMLVYATADCGVNSILFLVYYWFMSDDDQSITNDIGIKDCITTVVLNWEQYDLWGTKPNL